MSSKSHGKKMDERRTTRRREILNSFGSFVVIPQKGVHRLKLHDLSEEGIGFDLDIEGETPANFPLSKGESINVDLYFNPTLFISIKLLLTRIEGTGAVRRAGGHISSDKDSESSPEALAYQAYLSFIDQMDAVLLAKKE